MKVDLSLEERESLLRQLRFAVALQIESWDITLAMSEQVGLRVGRDRIWSASCQYHCRHWLRAGLFGP